MNTKRDSKGNIYIDVQNIRITFVRHENRSNLKDWPNADVLRIQAYRGDESNALHQGAEYPIYNNESINKLIEALLGLDNEIRVNIFEQTAREAFGDMFDKKDSIKQLQRVNEFDVKDSIFDNLNLELDANSKNLFWSYNILENLESLYIALPQRQIDLFVIETIQNACGDMMEVLGFELKQKDEPVYGSFFQFSKFKLKYPKTTREIEDSFNKAKVALEARYLNLPAAEATEKYVNAASNLINSLQGIEESVMRIGALLVVKNTIDGKTKILAETLSPQLMLLFESNPQLMNSPSTVYQMIQTIKTQPNHFKETDEVGSNIIE